LKNFVIAQFGIRNIVSVIFYKYKNAFKAWGCQKKKCYTMMGGDRPFWLPFFLTVKKKEGPFSKFKPFFLNLKKKNQKI
jgi:hypothetical protein